MTKLYNVTEIRAEDFPEDMRQSISILGGILNPFMQQLVELADGRVDFDNLTTNIRTLELNVDSDGKPIQNNKLQTGKTQINGFQVIAATNLTNKAVTVTAQPFINDFTLLGGGLVQINEITGLPANSRFRLTILIY